MRVVVMFEGLAGALEAGYPGELEWDSTTVRAVNVPPEQWSLFPRWLAQRGLAVHRLNVGWRDGTLFAVVERRSLWRRVWAVLTR